MLADSMYCRTFRAVGAVRDNVLATCGTVTCGTFFKYTNTLWQENLPRPIEAIFRSLMISTSFCIFYDRLIVIMAIVKNQSIWIFRY